MNYGPWNIVFHYDYVDPNNAPYYIKLNQPEQAYTTSNLALAYEPGNTENSYTPRPYVITADGNLYFWSFSPSGGSGGIWDQGCSSSIPSIESDVIITLQVDNSSFGNLHDIYVGTQNGYVYECPQQPDQSQTWQ